MEWIVKNGNLDESSGKDGKTTSETITIISGTPVLDNISVYGPDGGSGGKGENGNYAVYLKTMQIKHKYK